MIAGEAFGLSLAEWVIALAAVAYVVDRAADALGLNRSAKSLRQENSDLTRYNDELQGTVAKHEVTIQQQAARIVELTARVEELEKRDQAAVLASIAQHEENAERRHEKGLRVLGEIRDALHGGIPVKPAT